MSVTDRIEVAENPSTDGWDWSDDDWEMPESAPPNDDSGVIGSGVREQTVYRIALVCAVIGGVLLVAGWWQVSGTVYVAEQLAYFASASVGGLFLVGVAALIVISIHYRRMRAEVRSLRRELTAVVRLLEADTQASE